MADIILFLVIGLTAGILSGLLGIGGGIIIVPALVFLFGFSQHQAQGTTLALMVPPIGILAAYVYYKQGFVNLKASLIICLGFLIGGFLGARLAGQVSGPVLSRIFGLLFVLLGLRMIFFK
ncbi:MAG: TSUP family transporter [bacterium]|nr:TSUP family transporter [bacterium]